METFRQQGFFLLKESPSYTYSIPGDPTPWMRARVRSKLFYDGQKSIKLLKGIPLRNQHDGQSPLNKALSLRIVFYLRMPVSWGEKKRASMVGKPQYCRPDFDNFLKFMKDLSVDVRILTDDSIVAEVVGCKMYDKDPRTEFTFYEIV